MSGTAGKRTRKSSVLKSDKKQIGLWIDPARLPHAKTHFTPPENCADDYLTNRYLQLADLVLKEPAEKREKKKTA